MIINPDKTKRPFRALNINYKLPVDLQNDIDEYIDYLNNSEYLSAEEGYRTYIDCDLNWAKSHQELTEDKIKELRDYYVRGGIYNNG